MTTEDSSVATEARGCAESSEDGGREKKVRNVGTVVLETGKVKIQILSYSGQRACGPDNTLILAQ